MDAVVPAPLSALGQGARTDMLRKHERRDKFTAIMLAQGWTRPMSRPSEEKPPAVRSVDLCPEKQAALRATEKMHFPTMEF